ncbi:MAG: hypothetical protein HYY05_03765 [Chloroflexi bacterium]|nr:hypothetical protein [Chloroflexota bacterium]
MATRKCYTALGPIHPDQMGLTAEHEHILWGPPGWEYDPEWWWYWGKVYERCHQDLVEFKNLGGGTLVDVSGIGLGRDVELYSLLQKTSGVNVVLCTGFWPERGFLGEFWRDIDFHEELYVRELTQGIQNTDVRAGIIKVGTGRDRMTEMEEVTFRAAARAAKKTGCCVTTHGVWTARRQVQVFEEEGVSPNQVVIGHLEDASCLDFDRDVEIAKKGYYIGYDHIGIEQTWSPMFYAMPDEQRADMVKAIIDAGLIDRLIISADVNSFSLGWQRSAPYVGKSKVGDLIRFISKMKRVGITDDQVHTLLYVNPQRVIPF